MKLFVSDIDGTLYWYNNQNNSGCSEACKAAIKRWIKAGNIFAVATARVYTMADYTCEDIGVNVDYLGGNGAEIVYRDKQIELHALPISIFDQVKRRIEEKKWDATVKICVDKQFIANSRTHYPFTQKQRMRKNLKNARPAKEVVLDEHACGVNMSLLCPTFLTKKIEADLREMLQGKCQVLATDCDNIDFIPLNVGKSKAILDLAKRYGISAEDIIVIGDASNDVCMFEITEHSYCMSHSEVAIKDKAAHVVGSVEEAIAFELAKLSEL